jgi:hypothetical protein
MIADVCSGWLVAAASLEPGRLNWVVGRTPRASSLTGWGRLSACYLLWLHSSSALIWSVNFSDKFSGCEGIMKATVMAMAALCKQVGLWLVAGLGSAWVQSLGECHSPGGSCCSGRPVS